MQQESGSAGIVMTATFWYLLKKKGSEEHRKEEVECSGSDSISRLKKLVLKDNPSLLINLGSGDLEVYTHENRLCSSEEDVSGTGCGSKSKPFIIYYSPGTFIFVALNFCALSARPECLGIQFPCCLF